LAAATAPASSTTESYVLDGSLSRLAIPTTLQASLVARLDRLGSAKDVAFVGAAIGREFSHELVAATSAMTPTDLDAALERLTASGLVSRRGTPPHATYVFKHALLQDAAYAAMLKSQRQQLHSTIANVLVERFAALAQNRPEIVAHHFGEAGSASEAIDYWRRAAQLASARSAMREAVSSFERALQLLEALPETRERQEKAIDLRCDLSNALFALGTFELRFLRAAVSLAEVLDDRRRLGQVCVYLCRNAFMAGHLREAREFGARALALAQSLGDVSLEVTGSLYFGAACFHLGDYALAEDLFLKVLKWLEGDRRRERFGLAGFPAVIALGFLAWLLADRGRFEQAIAHGEEGLRLADSLNHPYSQVFALWMLGRAHVIRGDLSNAVRLHERGLAISREWKLALYSLHHMGSLGYAYALSGRAADGIPLLQDAQTALDGMEYGLAELMLLEDIGETYLAVDRLADAHDVAERVLDLARERDQVNCEAWALRLLGEVAGRRDPEKHADDHLRNALALAEELGMRPLVARCHLGLGKLAGRKRKRQDAQDHLATAATMCREMGMGFWLEQAEAEIGQDALSDGEHPEEMAKPAMPHQPLNARLPTSAGQIQQMKVLIVDDHALIRDALHTVLKQLRHDAVVFQASNGRQAMRIVAANSDLGLILLDLNLPDRDGFSVLSELREHHAGIAIIILSAFDDQDKVKRALSLGALGFIPKSTEREVMLNAIRLVLSGGIYIPSEILDGEGRAALRPR
jgi:CheY-like chemotaxis protein